MNTDDRDKVYAERRKLMMEGDFNPGYRPEATPAAEYRMVNAAEYAAYQLGQINQSMKKILILLEQKT
jgi:hypothetical protein